MGHERPKSVVSESSPDVARQETNRPGLAESVVGNQSKQELASSEVRKEFNGRVQDVLPLVKKAGSVKELWLAVDTIEDWRGDIRRRRESGEEVEDPQDNEELMELYLRQYTSRPHREISPIFKEVRNILKDEVAKKCKELGLILEK